MLIRKGRPTRGWVWLAMLMLVLAIIAGPAVSGVFAGRLTDTTYGLSRPSGPSGPANAPLAPTASNLVVNGDFETGSLSPNWVTTIGSATNTINGSVVHSGSWAVKVASTSGSSTVGLAGGGGCTGGSRIAVSANTSYDWTGWIRADSTSQPFSSAFAQLHWF